MLTGLADWAARPDHEVVLVDDGSADGGFEQARAWVAAFNAEHPGAHTQLLRLAPGEGKGGAVRAGVLAARGARIAFTDSDLPYGLDAVDRLLNALGDADVAVGARDVDRGDDSVAPPARRLASVVFRTWVALWADTGAVTDTQCGVKAFRREVVHDLFFDLTCRGFAFDIEVLALAEQRGLRVERVPVQLQSWAASSIKLSSAGPALLFGTLRAARAVARRRAEGTVAGLDVALGVAAALLVLIVVLAGPQDLGGRDWDQFQADLSSARRSLLRLEAPLWMPYRTGGHDAWADPQSAWFSPLGACALLFGVGLGCRVFLALGAGVAALGAARLGAHLGLEPEARAACAVLYALAPPLGLYAAGGIPTFTLGLALLPWLVLAVLRGTRSSALVGGGLLAVALYGGDVNHFLFHSLFLLGLGALLLASDPPGRRRRRLAHGAVLFVAAALLGAPKLIPTALLTREVPRKASDKGRGALTADLLTHVLLNRGAVRFVEKPWAEFVLLHRDGRLVNRGAPDEVRRETVVDWVNVGSYLGWAGLLLALVGLVTALAVPGLRPPRGPPRRVWAALVAVGLLFLWLGWGHNAPISPWRALKPLPVFSSLRSPGRMVLYPWFVLVLLAGAGLQVGLTHLRARSAHLAVALAAVAGLGLALDVFPPAARAYRQAFVEPDRYPIPDAQRFTSLAAPYPSGSTYYGVPVYPFAKRGYAVTNGYTAVPVPPSALPRQDSRYRGEATVTRGTAELGALVVTARRIDLPVKTTTEATVVLNQNHARGWSVAHPADATLRKHTDGRLAVDLPANTKRLRLRYISPGLGAGLLMFLLGLPLLLVLTARLPVPGCRPRGVT